ncbi:MAG: HD domain-containing protein [Treponema sp.]|nr:HD domain-containing protein [Treponema sp.]
MATFLQMKMQIACFIFLIVAGIQSIRDGKNNECNKIFDVFLAVTELGVLFDGLTFWTVNNQDKIPLVLNIIFHLIFLILMVTVLFLLFLYFLDITFGLPESKIKRGLILLPYVMVLIGIGLTLNKLEFISGNHTNYSMGIPVYIAFGSVVLLCLGILFIFFLGIRYIEQHKKISIMICLFASSVCTILQVIFPELLLTSFAVTVIALGIYLNLENPAYKKQIKNHKEMVQNFSTLIENRDDSTGGHVKRTTLYVDLIMKEMTRIDKYKNILTRDFMNNLLQAAPMHDIGKISVPDSILQKPGKLTDDEFAVMKTHTVRGGDIIQETFGNNPDKIDFVRIAYKVAQFHHEKWNGKGYPEGLSGYDIPLCARIMAVADVFDAVSAKRCYRDAMPLDQCFEIIMKGRGVDFDPEVVDIFLNAREKVEEIYNKNRSLQK